MDGSFLGLGRKRATSLDILKRTRKLYEVTEGKTFRIMNLRPEDIGYRPDQKSQLYHLCRRLVTRNPKLLVQESYHNGYSYTWCGIPPKVETKIPPEVKTNEAEQTADQADQFKILRAEMGALTSQVTALSSRVKELEEQEDFFLRHKATQVASTLADLSPPQQEYVLRLVADLVADKKSDK